MTAGRTHKLVALALRGATQGERNAARNALRKHDPNADMKLGIMLVGCGPEPGEKWIAVEPRPLGKMRTLD